jgi:hypothetical protein
MLRLARDIDTGELLLFDGEMYWGTKGQRKFPTLVELLGMKAKIESLNEWLKKPYWYLSNV